MRALNKFNAEDTSTYLALMKATIGEAIGANGGSDEIDLLELLHHFLRKWWLFLIGGAVGGVVFFLVTSFLITPL